MNKKILTTQNQNQERTINDLDIQNLHQNSQIGSGMGYSNPKQKDVSTLHRRQKIDELTKKIRNRKRINKKEKEQIE